MLLNINPEIFRQYDIRGFVGRDLNPDIANFIGRAFGTYLINSKLKTQNSKLKVSVGRDVRLHSKELADALIGGVISTGIDVLDIGVCPTPVQYFSIHHLNLDGGVMITGSHNPPEFNGFKISVGKETIFGENIQDIRKIIDRGDFKTGSGKRELYDIIPAYIDKLKKEFLTTLDSRLTTIKVVIDAGNGTAGIIAPKLFEDLGCNVIKLFCEPDGRFPNHHPDPTVVENLDALIKTVNAENADMGIAFDGDADRLGVVDSKGNIIWGDMLLLAFAKDIIESQKSKVKSQKSGRPVFVSEVKCSQIMYDEIEKAGGNAIIGRTGHSLIKQLMKEKGALLAGEMSGHMFFSDRYYGYDDAIYAGCRLIELLSKDKYYLKNIFSSLPRTFSTPEIRVSCPDNLKFKIIEELEKRFQMDKDSLGIKDIITIDGVRLNFNDGWGLIRASNTQPIMVMRFEAKTEDGLKRIQGVIEKRLKEAIK